MMAYVLLFEPRARFFAQTQRGVSSVYNRFVKLAVDLRRLVDPIIVDAAGGGTGGNNQLELHNDAARIGNFQNDGVGAVGISGIVGEIFLLFSVSKTIVARIPRDFLAKRGRNSRVKMRQTFAAVGGDAVKHAVARLVLINKLGFEELDERLLAIDKGKPLVIARRELDKSVFRQRHGDGIKYI
jgi:hypothetical protein